MSPIQQHVPVIGITMGDPVGIGPELIVKALSQEGLLKTCCPVVFGDYQVLQREIKSLGIPLRIRPVESPDNLCRPGEITLVTTSTLAIENCCYGKPTLQSGRAMAGYIKEATQMAVCGAIDAIVTAPINKKSLQDAGYDYPGHTEMLAHLTNTQDVVMMLAGKKLRVVLVTIHCALASVPQLLSTDKILKTIFITRNSLSKLLPSGQVRIGVAALNPHAGENGLFGTEEQQIIIPAIEKARAAGIDISGPYPPDTVFNMAVKGRFDVVVCMYHDQGLIPLKLLHFDDAVNVTLGLPVIRTSVDHGTAYDIAGRGTANPESLINAMTLASEMASTQILQQES